MCMLPAAVWVNPDDLHAWANNPRINANAVDQVALSLQRFGWGAPILASAATHEIVAGHTRLQAWRLLCARTDRNEWHADILNSVVTHTVPVRFGAWSTQEAHALAIADNKLNEIAEWDQAALSAVLTELDVALHEYTFIPMDSIADLLTAFNETDTASLATIDHPAQRTTTLSVCPHCGGAL